MGSLDNTETTRGNAVCIDASGNVYTTGYFRGTVDFDPGPAVYNLTAVTGLNIILVDIYVTKFDAAGNFVWAKQMAGILPPQNTSDEDMGRGITVDASGNVYVTGYFIGTTDFDPGPGVFNLTSLGVGVPDVFVLKLDVSGNLVWVKQFGNAALAISDKAYSIAIDATGNVYTTGFFYQTVDFDPGPGVYNLTAAGSFNAFISKLDAAGNFVMAKQLGVGSIDTRARSITVDATGNIYTTGNFSNTGDFDPGAGTFNLTALGGEDIFVSKLDASGNFLWAKQFGGSNAAYGDEGTSIAVDAAGNVCTTGFFSGTSDFDPGTGVYNKTALYARDAFVSKLDAAGNFVWVAQFGGTGFWQYDDMGYVVKTDASNNVYSIGYYNATVDFDPGPGTYYLSSANNLNHLYVSKLNAAGNFVWAIDFILPNYTGDFEGYGFDIHSSGDFFTTGLFNGTADFDPGAASFNMTATGSWDAFVARYTQNCTLIPTITSFTPTSGTIGTTVTITGTNFDPAPANNIVYFGATRATVSAATTTSLTVTVPAGATYEPITVTNPCSLTDYSTQPFTVTFPCGGTINSGSLAPVVSFASGDNSGYLTITDLDGDGKADVALTNNFSNTMSAFKNNSTSGTVSFAPRTDFPTLSSPLGMASGDIDGDGKPDLAITTRSGDKVSVFKNTSTPGSISFSTSIDLAAGSDPYNIFINDMDGDGKPDLVVIDEALHFVYIFRNISTAGNISFAPKVDYATAGSPQNICISDLDGDGKPDLATADLFPHSISVFRNTSTPGTISFAARIDLAQTGGPFSIAAGDLDTDGKPELAFINSPSGNVSILRNTSTSGNISFAPKIDFPAGIYYMCMADLDGDGKPEIATGDSPGSISILKNNCTTGNISFGSKVSFTSGSRAPAIGDLDGDGKADVVSMDLGLNALTVLRNTAATFVIPSVNITANPSGTICAGTSVTFTATPTNGGTTPSYQWKVNGINVGTNAATYSTSALVNGDIVTVILTSNASCALPTTATSNNITMTVTAAIIPSVGITASATTICNGANVTFTATPTNGGSTPSYQWKLNGINVGTNAPTYFTSALINGDIITVILTSNANCALPTTATSNTINMTVNPNVTPAVSIIANPSGAVCVGTSVTFTASPTNGGVAPSYQWQVNGVNVGTNSATYISTSLVNADIVKVILTSNANCASPTNATSNNITMQVNPFLTPAVNITANPPGSICAGTSVTFTAAPINGGPTPSYQWRVNGVNAGTNASIYTTSSLVNGDIVDVILTSNATCASPTTATSNNIIITVTSTVTPSVGITASTTNICAGASVTFSATPVNGGSTPVYQWKVNGINVGTNSPLYTTTTLANGDIVTAIMTSSLACASPTSASSNSITMIVNTNITPAVNITANPSGSVCAGTPVTFTATTSNIGGGSVNYNFKINGASVQSSASNTYSSTTLVNGNTVTCDITVTGGNCLTSASATSNIISMTVNPNLTPTVNITANPSGSICSGTPVTFTATSTNTGGGTVNYDFKVNGVSVQNGPSNLFTSSILINGNTVTCDISITGGNCMASTTATSNIITMNVTAAITPSVTVTASATTICAGNSVTFTATPINGGTTAAYQWKVNGINAGTNSPLYTTNSLANGDLVTVTMTSSLSCASPASVSSNTITMVVNPTNTPVVDITANPTGAVCTGTSITFTAVVSNTGGGTVSYNFRVNGTSIQNGASNTFTTATLSNGNTVTCDIVITGGACLTSPLGSSNTVTMNVSLPPVININADPAGKICTGTVVTFTATPLNTGTNPSFQWQLNGANVGSNLPTYFNSGLANGDKVNCVMNTISICSVTPNFYSDTISMVVNPIPIISFNPDNPTIFSGNAIQLSAQANVNIANYLWSPSLDLSNPIISNPIANPANTTVYKLSVTSTDNCYAEKNLIVTVIKEIYIPNSFTPNADGINDIFRIPPGILFTLSYLTIYDRYGNEVFKTRDISKGWDGTYKGARAPNGAYTYLIKGSDQKRNIFLTGTVLLVR